MPSALSSYPAKLLAGRALPLMEACALSAGAGMLLDVGPVPVPSGGRVPVRRTEEISAPAVDRNETLAVSCFGLSMLSEEARNALFSRLVRLAAHTLFIDFKTPERNIEWPGALLFSPVRSLISHSGDPHAGGMEGMIYDAQSFFSIVSRHTLYGGAICGILVRNKD